MAQQPADETLPLLASARALLEELSEEGLTSYPPPSTIPKPEVPRPPRSPDASPPRAAGAQAKAARSEPPRGPGAREAGEVNGARSVVSDGRSEIAETGERPTLEAVRSELGECTRCRLCEGRNQIVFGDGNPDADLLFVGEGPGADEDRRGLPFVGRAGALLTDMIEKGLQIPRSQVYICNIVKCRPPGNRTPHADEVATCRPFLDGQIRAVAPKVIVALGKPATSLLLGRDVPITRERGRWHEYRGIPLMPTFHPAFVLRQYTVENRRLVWEDLKAALARSREPAPA